MPLINTTARTLGLTIGGQDWSTAVAIVTLGYDALSESGLITITGQAILQENASNPESIDPVNNAERWHPGVAVQLHVENDAGTLIDHPQGALYIVSEPAFDERPDVRTLTIELGCELAWSLRAEPADDVSAVTLGTSTGLHTVAQRYLEAAGIATADINLGTWPYSISAPLPKANNSPYVQVAGGCAYASDYRLLYTDSAGVVQALTLDTVAGTADLSLTLDTEELEDGYIRFPDGQEPFETVRVVGAGNTVALVATPITATTTSDDLDTLTREEYFLTNSDAITTPSTVDNTLIANRNAQRNTRYQTKEPGENVFEDGLGSSIKVVTDDRITVLYYEATNGTTSDPGVFPYRLFRTVEYAEKASGIIDGDDTTTPELYVYVITNYSYDADGRVSETTTNEWRREKEFDPDGGIQWRRIRTSEETWTPKGGDRWEYERIEKQAAIISKPDANYSPASNKWNLITISAEKRPARNPGENSPPAAEEWDGPYTETETTYEGEATWVHRGGATGRNRTKPPYQLPQGLGFSDAQCAGIAGKTRDVLDGRKRGYLIRLPISNALLALDRPLFQLDVTEPSGRVAKFLCDSVTWEHQQETAYVECAGILIADSLYP